MSTNKSISYILCNKGIIVNLYKLHFLSFPFSFQPNKRVFHLFTFPPLQPNTQEGKLNIFHPPTFPSSHNLPSSHFFTLPTKWTLKYYITFIKFGLRIVMSNNIFLLITNIYIYIYIYIYKLVILKRFKMAQRVLTSKILNLLKSSPSPECTAFHRLPSPLPTSSSIHLSQIAFELLHCCMPYFLVHFFPT